MKTIGGMVLTLAVFPVIFAWLLGVGMLGIELGMNDLWREYELMGGFGLFLRFYGGVGLMSVVVFGGIYLTMRALDWTWRALRG